MLSPSRLSDLGGSFRFSELFCESVPFVCLCPSRLSAVQKNEALVHESPAHVSFPASSRSLEFLTNCGLLCSDDRLGPLWPNSRCAPGAILMVRRKRKRIRRPPFVRLLGQFYKETSAIKLVQFSSASQILSSSFLDVLRPRWLDQHFARSIEGLWLLLGYNESGWCIGCC